MPSQEILVSIHFLQYLSAFISPQLIILADSRSHNVVFNILESDGGFRFDSTTL